MTPSPKNNVTVTASPLSSPSHQQQSQTDLLSTANPTSAFQIRKQNVVTATSTDTNSSNQSNQSVAQTTTLNLHGINFSSLQGAMATFPGLQNVQVMGKIIKKCKRAPRIAIYAHTSIEYVCTGSNSWAGSTDFTVTNWCNGKYSRHGNIPSNRLATW